MLDIDRHLSVLHVRIAKHLIVTIHRSARNAFGRQDIIPLGGRLVDQCRFHRRLQFLKVLDPVTVGGKARVVNQRLQPGQFAKALPVVLLVGRNTKITVFGLKGAVRLIATMHGAKGARHFAAGENGGGFPHGKRNRAVE